MDEKNNVTKSHKVLLANRKNGAFSGVVDVLSFDVAEILLETELGMLLCISIVHCQQESA